MREKGKTEHMKALVIGAAGFVGGYLMDEIEHSLGAEAVATKLPKEQIVRPGTHVADLDIMDADAVKALFQAEKPDVVFHLAAQSSVAYSWKNPQLTVDVNIKGALNVLDAMRAMETCPRAVLIGSGEEYGWIRPEDLPLREETALHPGNIYAATKAAQSMLAAIYSRAYQLPVVSTRSFNHIGRGQTTTFAIPSFCSQIARIERGAVPPVMRVGNTEAARDFTDVRDVVRAYCLLAVRGVNGEVYNVGRGRPVRIAEILSKLTSMSSSEIEIERDPQLYRPVDIPEIYPDVEKLRRTTGWIPEIPLEDSLRWVLDEWREKAGN